MGIKFMIRSMGISFFISFMINDFFIPVLVFWISCYGTKNNVIDAVLILTQMFTPFLAAFWVYLHLTKYIALKGNESFYLRKRIKLFEIIWLYILYLASNTIFYIWYGRIAGKLKLEWLHIAIMSFLFMMAAYCFCYWFQSISLAVIPVFVYVLASVVGLNDVLKKISYYENDGMRLHQFTDKYIYFLGIAVIFGAAGYVFNRRYQQYHV